jgi:hypothetical protein
VGLRNFCWAAAALALSGVAAAGSPCMGGTYLSALFAANQQDFDQAAKLYSDCQRRDADAPELLGATFNLEVSAGRIND